MKDLGAFASSAICREAGVSPGYLDTLDESVVVIGVGNNNVLTVSSLSYEAAEILRDKLT